MAGTPSWQPTLPTLAEHPARDWMARSRAMIGRRTFRSRHPDWSMIAVPDQTGRSST